VDHPVNTLANELDVPRRAQPHSDRAAINEGVVSDERLKLRSARGQTPRALARLRVEPPVAKRVRLSPVIASRRLPDDALQRTDSPCRG
jgi:hypothetical protein